MGAATVKVRLSDDETMALCELAHWARGVAKEEASDRGDQKEVEFWARAGSVEDAADKAIRLVYETDEAPIQDGFPVELTEEGVGWVKDMRTDLAQTVEHARGTVEFYREDVIALFVLDTILKQLTPVSVADQQKVAA
jgi:hypothetical protein